MNWLFSRETMFAFALLGGGSSVLALLLQRWGAWPTSRIKQLHWLAYLFMGISVVLFVGSGFRGLTA